MVEKTIIYRGLEYQVSERVIEELNSMGQEFDDAYITYLLRNDSPCFSWGLTILSKFDIMNRTYIGKNSLLGRIVKLDKQGNVVAFFDTMYETVMDSINCSNKYSFESFSRNGIVDDKKQYDFFGLQINVSSNAIQTEVIKKLNSEIRRCKNRHHGRNKMFKAGYSKEVASRMSYDEYVMQAIRWHSFCFGDLIHGLFCDSESKYTKHFTENCGDYSERMKMLFHRYSKNNITLFEKIKDLNEIRGFSGIYLLCLPQIKGCYVGKTEKCFATRIPQHFTTPNSAFDKKYIPTDIQDIYILQLDEMMPLINLIEEDCIAVLGKEVCLNAVAGGYSIELIKSDRYDEKEHFLSLNDLNWVVEDAFNITQYRKNL